MEINNQRDNEINDLIYRYLLYLLSSASGLFDEPKDYGPFRLVEAAERFINIVDKLGYKDNDIEEINTSILNNKELLFNDKKAFSEYLDKLIVTLGVQMKNKRNKYN